MARKIKRINQKQTEIFLSEAITNYLNHKRNEGLRESSIETYQAQMDNFIRCLGDININEINEETLDTFLDWLEKNFHYNNQSQNHIRRTLNVFLKYLHQEYKLPQLKFKLLKSDSKIKEIFTDEEIKLLLKKPSNDCLYSEFRNYTIAHLILSTGIRASTVCHIKPDDLDLKKKELRLTHLKNRSEVVFPLNNNITKILKEYLSTCELDSDYLFENSEGEKLSTKQLSQSFYRYCKNRGCEHTSIHLLRHTFASLLIKKKVDIRLVQLMLTHNSILTTEKYIKSIGMNQHAKEIRDLDVLESITRLN